MKTTKLFFMAALALMTAACSNGDNDILTPAEQPANNMITITAQLAPKTNGATTRAVSDGTDKIVAEWAVNEHIAILYNKDGAQVADATITAVDGTTGVATITFNVEGGTPNDTPCTLVYPYDAAKGDHTGVKDAATLLAAQDGTLNANLDVRVGAGTIQTTTPGLTVTTQPAAQFAIMKLTLDQTAKDLYITAGGELIAGATLASPGTEFYVAVPAVDSKTVAVVATNGSSDCWSYSKDGVSLATGNYYQSSPKMTALGTESSADVYKMTGAGTIPDGRTVVLSDVTISSNQIACSGDATIILMGTNSVTANSGQAAIKIGDSGTTLTITGSGSLTATGGSNGAGIGTENNGSGGNIVINGGTVTATGGSNGAGIGTGRANKATNTCGDITINGGTVTATGGYNGGAGIGTGVSMLTSGTDSNTCGAITIGTGVTRVTANKSSGNSGPNSIGKGRSASGTQTCGTITIGGTIYWDGSAYQNDGEAYLGSDITYPTAP